MTEMNHSGPPRPGPLESGNFADKLLARVVTPGAEPRLHGYDVENDLAQHYSPSEVAFLAITGELPEADAAAALDAVLVFTSPVSVACAPTHAAVLAQLCGANPGATLGVAAIALAEQVKSLLDEHGELLCWLNNPEGDYPEQFRSANIEDENAVERLSVALRPSRLTVPILKRHPTISAAVLAVLHACGLRHLRQMEALIVWARLPVVLAEAYAESVANFKNYPINLPQFEYEESTS
jgi:hypothetical protein